MAEKNVANREEMNEEAFSDLSFQKIWTIVVLNWEWILLSTFIALCLAFAYLRYATPVYVATMKVLVKDDSQNPRYMRNGMMSLEQMGLISNSNGFDNELEILNSANLSARTVKSLKLYVSYAIEGTLRKLEQYKNNPIIVDMPEQQITDLSSPIAMEITKAGKGLKVKGEIFVKGQRKPLTFERSVKELPGSFSTTVGTIILQQNPGAEWKDEKLYATILPLETAAGIYQKKMAAKPTSKTTTVADITLNETQPVRAIDYLDDLLKSYNEDADEDKNEVAMKTEKFIEERINVIRGDLDVTEGQLEQYKRSNELINLTSDAAVALSSSSEYQKQQVELETQINLISALIDYMNNPANAMQVIPANLGLTNSDMVKSITEYNEIVLQRNRLLKSSSESNPYVQRLTSQAEEMWPSIKVSMESIYKDMMMQKRSTDNQYNRFSHRISNTPTQERALTNFSRQQEIKATIYLMLLQKREENFISLASTAAKARIVESPKLGGQVSPKRATVWLGALILGMCFPVGLIYLLGLLRYRIEGRDEVERLTKISILADIPLSESSEKALAVQENVNNSIDEAFRGLRTNLRFILEGDEKVVLCTSCIPSEGKTYVCTNLAMSLALLGKKVIIVGLDIRKPRLVKLFGLPQDKKGITSFLTSTDQTYAALEEQIYHGIGNPNLDVLPAGIIPPNPGELISREQLDCAVRLLREHYDYILIDTPPVGLVSDTLSIGRVGDMTLFVCRADFSPRESFNIINGINDEHKLPKVHLVLNGVDMKKKKYGYYYGYGKYGKYGNYGRYGHYGHYGVYGHYGEQKGRNHIEK